MAAGFSFIHFLKGSFYETIHHFSRAARVLLAHGRQLRSGYCPAQHRGGGGNQPQAFSTPCIPDCPETPFPPWQNFEPVLLELCPGCTVEVRYSIRNACNQYHDLYFESITTTNGVNQTNNPFCDACFNSMSPAMILAEVTRRMLLLNPMRFPPRNPGECETNWRVVKGPCWQKLFTDPDGDVNNGTGYQWNRLHWCETTETCCIDRFVVCINEAGERRITRQPPASTNPPALPCPTLVPGVYCDPACGIAPFGPEEP